MNPQLLQEIGLNEHQAKAYILLIKYGQLRPQDTTERINATRTNSYKVFEQLEELGLATKLEGAKKLTYQPAHPLALEKLAEEKRKSALEQEQKVKATMPTLLEYYFTHTEQPTVRMYQGQEGLRKVYSEQARTGKPIHLLRSQADIDIYGFEFMDSLRNMAHKHGIRRDLITPDDPRVAANWQEIAKEFGDTRTWMDSDDYTAPVEWDVYGDKTSIIVFGEEAMAVVIEHKQIAMALKQIFKMLQEGLRRKPDYNELPRLAGTEPADMM